ncbi:MAG: transposase [Cellvibrionaceae bacterium]|jgi:transposase
MSHITVRIDVSKNQLDCATTEQAIRSFTNNEADIEQLIRWLKAFDNLDRIVLEATGRYHYLCVSLLAKAGFPVVVANPRQVRDSAKATGMLAKTDNIDAAVLVDFGEKLQPSIRLLKDKKAQLLEAQLLRRRQVVKMITAESNRLKIAL